jgi:anti-sigma B factor antagonist
MITAHTVEGVCLIRIDGEMTIYTALACRDQLQQHLQHLQSCAALEIDLSGVTDVDSAGIQLLIQARRHAIALDQPVRLLNPSAAIQEMFALYRLGDDLDGASDVQQALTTGSQR